MAVCAYDQSPSRTIYLVDTPGFDHADQTDAAVLRDIAALLNDYYLNNIIFKGIIYLHYIGPLNSQIVMRRNMAIFQKLCGDVQLKRVTLVTTGWGKVPEGDEKLNEWQLTYVDELWGYMVKQGSTVRRHHDNEHTARNIVDEVAAIGGIEASLDIQEEMVTQQRALSQTSAGQELYNDYASRIASMGQGQRDLHISQRKLQEERIRKQEQLLAQQGGSHATELKLQQDESERKLQDEDEELERQRVRRVQKEKESERQEQEQGKGQQPPPEATQPSYREIPLPHYEAVNNAELTMERGSDGKLRLMRRDVVNTIAVNTGTINMSEYTSPQLLPPSKD